MENSSNNTIDLRRLFNLCRKHLKFLITCTIALALAGFIVSKFIMTPKYTATTQLLVNQKNENNANGQAYNNQQADIQVINTYKDIITSPVILKETKKEFVPEDGWILPEMEVKFTTGDTVFDILKKICGEKNIQLSSKYTPLYKSYYVEGINQLYEFDCGKNSGWMYSVNGEFPNYGASSYKPKDGDKIEWKYTCNLGSDVGNPYKDKK